MENLLKRCGRCPVCEFEGWQETVKKERDLVYFAVKKEHDMNYEYDKHQNVLTYDELVFRTIDNGESEFMYHNHCYMIQKNEDGGYDVISISNGEKVAETLIDGDERIVVIDDSKREYIRNTRSAYYENMYKHELEKIRTKDYPKIPRDENEI